MSTPEAELPKARVVLCWHMHQPSYFNPGTGDYQLPWVYLHAIKDYVDMAAHLEAVPEARAVVNFSPTLIEQIEDYSAQVAGFLAGERRLQDPLLRALAEPVLPDDECERRHLVQQCLRVNHRRLVEPFPAFHRLVELSRWVERHGQHVDYLSDQFMVDLLVWYHLAWLGETVRRRDPRVRRLLRQEAAYTIHDRRELLEVIGELMGGVLERYRRLADSGRVELSVTPYAHPILPLLQDVQSAREAWPEIQLPLLERYFGGEERARWHVERGIETFEKAFGRRPEGCWPAEGGVSRATLELLAESGFRWAASGGAVLDNSLRAADQWAEDDPRWHRAYTLAGADGAAGNGGANAHHPPLHCFFRDDGLSDAIGFEYSDWHGDDAVANLVNRLEEIADRCADPGQAVISIIMDGENAWEHYPANGYFFLSGLYRQLADHPRLEMTTFAAAAAGVEPRPLERLVAGSWVYGTFSTWIGEADKNRAWDMLGEAKQAFDRAVPGLKPEVQWRAEAQLAICESSDWFWWFGDYNPAGVVREFDHLYRVQLTALYEILGVEPPEHLSHAFTHRGKGSPEKGGVMRHGRADG
ncbi:glycoside hydrolase family 57 protein [Alkalilimnicola ehrlichii MLHE-1]|uniref:Glycoside hydrolase, family 57 n=1 Tax=Alkalilimnicola ehrlichii (strain ATCC BAA-1101 / DSM 17681 / MLHE-1) TaxID=187272 RepID=Q0AA24_ALKEH|nr:glycoside hydrolase family 57 protein [Alkalilimnicola ehrlichii]ABI56313.1 glycoside hydrolase, family 57 [Alkalilimnicola ehrlichii MLHE-1]